LLSLEETVLTDVFRFPFLCIILISYKNNDIVHFPQNQDKKLLYLKYLVIFVA